MNTKNLVFTFSTYYGKISVRVYDTVQKKNVAKMELQHLTDFLNKKADQGRLKFTEKGKGNTLAVVELK